MFRETRNQLILALFAVFGSAFLVTGCAQESLFEPHRVSSHEKAGAANIAVTMIAPFEEYIDALSPNIKLSSSDAVKQVIPKTTLLDQRLLDVMTAAVQVAVKRDVTNDDLPTTTEDPSLSRNATALLNRLPNDAAMLELNQDPILTHTAATYLLQEVELLNRYVRNAALRRDHIPYVVRLQLNLTPYARNQPYDHYATIGFFTKGTGKSQPVLVLPLLVTDNLERTSTQRTLDVVRQFASALRLLQGSFLGNLTFSSFSEKLENVLGSDHNSVLSLGRITDNTIQVRLGARRQATAGYATVPQSHNITAVVMVPRSYATYNGPKGGMINVNLHTMLRDAESGAVLPSDPNDTVCRRYL